MVNARPRGTRSLKAAATIALAAMLLLACGTDDATEVTLQAGSPAAEGQQIAKNLGCMSCHSTNGKRKEGPTWKGLAGSEVQLKGGRTVTADTNYLTRSISDPGAEVVESFRPIMPSYDLSKSDREAIIAFIQALSG